jgi:DNA polymerase theta
LEVEMPICKILGLMESRGVGCDHDFLAALRPKLASLQMSLTRKASELVKRVVHLSSHQQVKAVLFEILGLDVPECARRRKQGGPDNVSVDKNVLQELIKKYPNQEFPSIVLKFRKISDTITDLDSLIRHCTTESYSSVPVIHAQFCQTSAATGRIASDEPNLQCVPKTFDIEDILDPMVINLRKSIVPKLSSRIIVSADFRHIELRVMAHLSADQSMIKMFQNPLADPFKLLACKWLRVETEEAVTSEQRQQVKHLTYGLLYGMGEQRLGKELNVSAAKAKEMKEDFLNSFPDLANWIKNLIVGCKRDGHVTTLFGRFRWLTGINAEDGKERARCERAAVNSVCQGSAADITKLAMCNIERALHSKYGRDPPCTSVLQIHDELLFEVERDSIQDVVAIVKKAMESAVTMSVPLPVQFQYGKSWGELVPY